jgi:hypothetical protein
MAKIGRNDPCPCGSGRKHKRCCLATPAGFAADERTSALGKLERFIEEELEPEDHAAYDEFYDHRGDRMDGLDRHWTTVSEDAYDTWFALDRRLPGGNRPADLFLRREAGLTRGERLYLERVSDTALRLYEVVDVSPGVSLTLRDVERGSHLTVHEELGSRALCRATLLAARVIDPGASGQPEIERGLLHYPDLVRDSVKSQLSALRQRLRDEGTRAAEAGIDEHTGLFLHDAWASCLLDPPIPRLETTDGEDLLFTRVRFDVDDEDGLAAALDRGGELASEPERLASDQAAAPSRAHLRLTARRRRKTAALARWPVTRRWVVNLAALGPGVHRSPSGEAQPSAHDAVDEPDRHEGER